MADPLDEVMPGQAFRPRAETHNAFVDATRQVRAWRQITRHDPVSWASPFLKPMIVTERANDNENCAVAHGVPNSSGSHSGTQTGFPFGNSRTGRFRAKPYRSGAEFLRDLDDDDSEVLVSAMFDFGVLFTGQLFFITTDATDPHEVGSQTLGLSGYPVLGGNHNHLRGIFSSDTPVFSSTSQVDISYVPDVTNEGASANRRYSARVHAHNNTGRNLLDRQPVVISVFATAPYFVITDFECLDTVT